MGDLEAEAAVRQHEDLVGGGAGGVAPGIGDDDDLELEPLGGVDRQQAHDIGALLLGDGFQLARAHVVLVADEADEALDVGATQLLERARQPPELAQVRVAAATIPPGQHRQVVVVRGDDLLAEPLQRERRQQRDQALVALAEGEEEVALALRRGRRGAALQPGVDRPLARRAAQRDQAIIRHADERRGEHRDERLVVVAVVQEAQVGEQIEHLLLAVVVASGAAEGAEALLAQRLLEQLGVGAGGKEQDDVACLGLARVDEGAHPPSDMLGLGLAPGGAAPLVRRLVGDEQLDRGAGAVRGGCELAGGLKRAEILAEVGGEEVVDDREHLGPRAVVARQRERIAGGAAALAEDLHVGVAEAVDRLELVADKEQLLGPAGVGVVPARDQVDELALEPVRVLELVHEHRAEAPRLAAAHVGVVAQQVAGAQLEILEVERRLTLLGSGVRGGEALEQLLQQVAVAGGTRIERCLHDGLAQLLVGGVVDAAGTGGGVLLQAQQLLRDTLALEEAERAPRVLARDSPRLVVPGQGLGLGTPGRDGGSEPRVLAQLQHELPPRRAQPVVDAGQHPAQAARAVGGEQVGALALAGLHEAVQRLLEGLALQHERLVAVEHAEARIEAGRERVCLEDAQAEAVDRRDPGAVQLACQAVLAQLQQARSDARAQLAGSAVGVGDDEDRADVELAVADGAREALDEDGGLAGACAGRHEDEPVGVDRGLLLGVGQAAH